MVRLLEGGFRFSESYYLSKEKGDFKNENMDNLINRYLGKVKRRGDCYL
ncbi:hypothetical protein ACR77J_06295 [Tissierella praeacuta]